MFTPLRLCLRPYLNAFYFILNSLDHLANNIASATFGVINEGKVRTADMGGKLFLNFELDKNYLVY